MSQVCRRHSESRSRRVRRVLSVLFVPGGLIVLGACILAWRPLLIPPVLIPVLPMMPAVVFLAGLLLAWLFHRSRTTFAVLVVGGCYAAMQYIPVDHTVPWSRPALPLVGLLLPINLAGLLVTKERGVFTPKGLWLLGAIVLQGIVLVSAAHSGSTAIGEGLARTFVDRRWTAWTGLPQIVVLAFAGAFSFLLVRFSMTQHPEQSGLIWALVALFLALHAHHNRDSLLYFLAAGLILVASLLQTSYAMAYHDELTGLAGRRAFNETLVRLGSHYVIAMIDVDHFKRFNDTYGHEVGDQVLKMVASHIRLVSGAGQAFRYGGEEFAVVFPGTSLPEAVQHLDILRATIEGARFTCRGRWRPRKKPAARKTPRQSRKEVSVTVSMGAAEPSDRGVDPAQVVIAADRALYRAKKGGRNQLKY